MRGGRRGHNSLTINAPAAARPAYCARLDLWARDKALAFFPAAPPPRAWPHVGCLDSCARKVRPTFRAPGACFLRGGGGYCAAFIMAAKRMSQVAALPALIVVRPFPQFLRFSSAMSESGQAIAGRRPRFPGARRGGVTTGAYLP